MQRTPVLKHLIFGVVLAVSLLAIPGCGYTLHGKVVRGAPGEMSSVEIVHEIDPRL